MKKEFSEEKKIALMNDIKSRLDALPAIISEIRKMEVGLNVRSSDRAFDVCLVSEFDSMEDVLSYTDHPAHVEVADFIKSVRDRSFLVDFVI